MKGGVWEKKPVPVPKGPLTKGRRRNGAILAAGVLILPMLGGCGILPFRVEGESPFAAGDGPQRKNVAAKEAPSRLTAVDGTVCLVPGDKFDSVKIDDKVWCDWKKRW